MPAASARPHAPAFPKGFSWFNTDRPLAFDSDLKGRIVVMDFWTYCCINCMHMLPELAKVEEHYRGRPVVIIGVHSNKFANEGDAANVRAAILRYKIRHPVIVDEGHRIWDEYTVRAWPTLMFVDAEGRVVGRLEGENSADTIIRVIDGLLAEGEASGALAAGPPRLRPEQMVPSSSGLAFPGKVLADPAGNRLFIADSGHNRIIQASLEGKISAIYGSGEPGLADGPAASARFNNPQGMALDGAAGLLFVADTDNHALRQINLATGDVTTIAGTGMIGNDRRGGGIGTAQPLNSPWALALDKNTLYIAMAGLHQIWSFDRVTGRVGAFAGSGREGIRDGNNADAALAQPSGLSFSRNRLYFADSEVSAVRYVDLAGNRVQTLVGTGLFDFGDRDGRAERALLQHPLDLAVSGNMVYIADTYNHKIKFLDIELARIETIYGGAGELYEPGGISLARGKLYIADTNHHRILVTDIPSRWTRELALMGWPARTESPAKSTRESVVIGPLRTDAAATIRFDVHLPPNTELNMLAPMTVNIAPVGGARLIGTHNGAFQVTAAKPHLPFEAKIPITDQPSEGIYNIDLTFAYCTESDKALCIPASIRLQAKIATNPNGQPRATIHHALKPPSG